MITRKTVVIGFLGTTLDKAGGAERWNRWRPTVALCQHNDLLIDRLELIHDAKHISLAETVTSDIHQVSPETDIRLRELDITDPWDFSQVYEALHGFASAYDFKPDDEDYLIQITTGTHVAQICMFLLTEARYFPGRLLQLSPPKRWREGLPGAHAIIDLDLSRYDRIAPAFPAERAEGTSFLKSGIDTRNAGFNRMIEQIENGRDPLATRRSC